MKVRNPSLNLDPIAPLFVIIELMTSTLDNEKHDSYFNYLIQFSMFFIGNFAFPVGPSTYKRLNNKRKKS